MTYTLPPVSALKSLTPDEQTELLNNLFEPHPTIVNYLKPVFQQEYTSYPAFIDAAHVLFSKLNPQDDITKEIVSSHPRLGLPKTAELSEHSSEEQKSLQGDETVKEFTKLNKLYEDTFPGLRFVLFVNGRSKDEVKRCFLDRIQRNSYDDEVKDAIKAMCDIAKDRVRKLQLNKL